MVLSLSRWMGKVAIVTGASSGIGAAIADALVANGVIVAGLARRSERIQERAKKLQGKLHAIRTDMRKEDEIIKAFKWVEKNLGQVHILINNAGVSTESFLANGDTEAWRNIFDVNVMGLCIATREAVKSMTTNDINGHIVHISSIAGHKIVNVPGINAYTASKHAVTALAGTLRNEFLTLGSKIKITSVSPGLVISEMTTLGTGYSAERQEMMKSQPILKPEDVADAVCYALSTPENVEINELTITPVGERI
ncbi:farnesol dehydrogenase [Tribolium castaneum]|nr:PREDICTED: farnesol dehydrogenase [Tribolium castaneum]|eukprot:XP_968973.1 PREDICTED: farnesol dehydrogenase [Tribolium castaneum]